MLTTYEEFSVMMRSTKSEECVQPRRVQDGCNLIPILLKRNGAYVDRGSERWSDGFQTKQVRRVYEA